MISAISAGSRGFVLKAVRSIAGNQFFPTNNGSSDGFMNSYVCIAPDVKLGRDVKLSKFINLYGCDIGDETKIGAFVEIQKNATVGKRCKISSHTFICEGVT